MTALCLAEPGEAADLAAFLARLIKWDKAAVTRVRAEGGVLALFGRPPFGASGVLAVRTSGLREAPGLDATVSAGQLLDGIDEGTGAITVPAGVTGPAWAGMLPPRGGWNRVTEPVHEELRAAAARTVAEFRARTDALAPGHGNRAELDALAEEIWSRAYEDTVLPLRAVHAAHALGFLRAPGGYTVLSIGPWVRLRTPYGSVAVRRASAPPGFSVTPV